MVLVSARVPTRVALQRVLRKRLRTTQHEVERKDHRPKSRDHHDEPPEPHPRATKEQLHHPDHQSPDCRRDHEKHSQRLESPRPGHPVTLPGVYDCVSANLTLPSPPRSPGLTWCPITADDAGALADHTRRVHEAERLDFLPGAGYFRWLLEQPGIDPEHDLLVAVAGDNIVADTGAWLHAGDAGARCIIWAETSPGYEHLKAHLLEWSEARARQRLGTVSSDLARVLRIGVEEHRQAHREAIEAAGFDSPRSFADMARPLSDLPPAPDLIDKIEVFAWSDDLEEATRLASNKSFADHWGSLPMAPAEFSGFFRNSPTFRPDLSFLALEHGEVVSFCLSEVDDEDNADRDTNDVYLQRVGTVRSRRGRRLASHLIVRSMEAAASADGLDRAVLQVDEMSHTNATLVYQRLGFETYSRSLTYVKTL